jgi:hypothetical protein
MPDITIAPATTSDNLVIAQQRGTADDWAPGPFHPLGPATP